MEFFSCDKSSMERQFLDWNSRVIKDTANHVGIVKGIDHWQPTRVGLPLYYAIASNAASSNDRFIYSSDLSLWAPVTVTAHTCIWTCMDVNPAGRVVVLGHSASNKIATVGPGKAFTLINTPVANQHYVGVKWVPFLSRFFAASTSGHTMTSPEGDTWTAKSISMPVADFAVSNNSIMLMSHSGGVVSTTDGNNFSEIEQPIGTAFSSIMFDGLRFVLPSPSSKKITVGNLGKWIELAPNWTPAKIYKHKDFYLGSSLDQPEGVYRIGVSRDLMNWKTTLADFKLDLDKNSTIEIDNRLYVVRNGYISWSGALND